MKEIIEFKKDIVFKNIINEITNLDLTHEYKVMDDVIEGIFHLSGNYKVNISSINSEEFYYKIPFAIALSDRINKDSVNIQLEDFNYEIEKDILKLEIKLNMSYEENEKEEKKEEEEVTKSIDEFLNDNKETEEDIEETKDKEEVNEEINNISDELEMNDEFMTYKIHIVKENETYESISQKYKITLDTLKEYNAEHQLNVGEKLVIPFKNE